MPVACESPSGFASNAPLGGQFETRTWQFVPLRFPCLFRSCQRWQRTLSFWLNLNTCRNQMDVRDAKIEARRYNPLARNPMPSSDLLDLDEIPHSSQAKGQFLLEFLFVQQLHLKTRVPTRNSDRWNPSGKSLPIVSLTTRGPANPMSALGSAIFMSPNIAKDAVTPPVVGSVKTEM